MHSKQHNKLSGGVAQINEHNLSLSANKRVLHRPYFQKKPLRARALHCLEFPGKQTGTVFLGRIYSYLYYSPVVHAKFQTKTLQFDAINDNAPQPGIIIAPPSSSKSRRLRLCQSLLIRDERKSVIWLLTLPKIVHCL